VPARATVGAGALPSAANGFSVAVVPNQRIGKQRTVTLDGRIANARGAALGRAVAVAAYVSHGTSEVCGPVGKRLAYL
jgi:hypothetical protein